MYCPMKAIIEYYNKTAAKSAMRYQGRLLEYFKNLEGDVFLSLSKIDNKKIVLDVGTGVGWFVGLIESKAKTVVGIDFSKERLRIAKSEYDGEFILGDAKHLPFKDKSFNLVVCMGMFEYVKNLTEYLYEMKRVMDNNSELIFTTANQDYMLRFINNFFFFKSSGGNKVNHTMEGVKSQLEACGFELIGYTSTFFFHPMGISKLPHGLDLIYLKAIICLNKALAIVTPKRGGTLIFHCKVNPEG
ncbi:class I SAM-dependent methyltransferase [Methanophagales archaeon]|nr:MAG: class I SAM-dependent methyltransferase [Methanophagales archaeon]